MLFWVRLLQGQIDEAAVHHRAHIGSVDGFKGVQRGGAGLDRPAPPHHRAAKANIHMTILQNIIEQFVVKEYAQMLIEILQSRSFNTVALVTILVSIYTVSRGIGNIYEISKRMYQPDADESIIGFYLYTIKITIYLLLLFIGVIGITAIGPLAYIFNFLYSYAAIRHILLYFLICFCLTGIYMIVPRMKIHYSDAFQGALVASVLLLILYYALNIYFQFADYQSVYGPLASIVIVLFVFNWTAEFFYVGMYITNILYFRRISNEKRKSRSKEIGN